MRARCCLQILVAIALWWCTSPAKAQGADLSTHDALTLRLDDATGAVQAVVVNGRTLPRLEGVPGGLSYRELRPVKRHQPKVLASIDLDNGGEGWVKVTGGNWQAGEDAAAVRRADGGAAGSQSYVRLGEKQRYGHGVGFKQRVPVEPGGLYEISWLARVPSKSATYILYLRLLDEAGRDITEQTPPAPGKWRYSPWTKTHYQYPIEAESTNAWETLSRTYLVPEDVAHLQIALCLYRGDYVDADSLRVADVGRGGWRKINTPKGPLTLAPEGKPYLQRLSLREDNLEFTLKYVPRSNHIWVEGEVRDTHDPPRDRALQVCYTLPIGAKGWSWHDDIRTRRRIDASTVYQNVFSCAGHTVSLYPFSSIDDGSVGLALGVPMDWPRIERRQYSLDEGYQISFDLGLSPLTEKIGPGKATFAFAIYRTDAEWGFRSAAAKYYQIFPHLFVKRAQREGCWWLSPVRPSEIPNPEDFGLTFWETWEDFSGMAEEIRCASEHGVYILPYTLPRQWAQFLPGMKERKDSPPYEDVLAALQKWATDRLSEKKWLGHKWASRPPRGEIAQAVLNSLPRDADGRAPSHISNYDIWAQFWMVNTDPDLPEPNCGRAGMRYRIIPQLPYADGFYVDNVFLVNYENYRETHIACADVPLTFSRETGKPVLLGDMSFYDFLAWFADDLHAQGKLVQMNIYRGAYRFYAHLGDVLGSEVGSFGHPQNRRLSEVESDPISNMRRTFAYQKPTTNLLQEGNYRSPVPALTREQVEQYLDHQTFYGFYPGISAIGGEEKPGFVGWKRYFRSPEQFERDRELFKKYIPIIRRINRAGWEPVTYAKTSDESVIMERFGSWDKGDLHFTLRNQAEEEKSCVVVVQLAALGAKREGLARVSVKEILSGSAVQAKSDASGGAISFQLKLRPAHTAVISVISVSGEEE